MGSTSQCHHITTAPQFSNAAQNGEVPLVGLASHCAWISSTFNCVNTKLDNQVDQKKDKKIILDKLGLSRGVRVNYLIVMCRF